MAVKNNKGLSEFTQHKADGFGQFLQFTFGSEGEESHRSMLTLGLSDSITINNWKVSLIIRVLGGRTTQPKKKDEDLVNYFNKTEQLKDHGYSKIIRLRNNTDLDELRDKAADRTEWQCIVEKLGETTGEVDDSGESTTEAED